ncbi:hypothetical protein CN326_03340 [Bacillus sp. AFS018417]|uniref:hypothetical protein n=1 Tax=Bacillus TaxID=1386 RepID=UPI000BF78AA3|nr:MULTISPECIES: hypothetical protein [unclassified Bacillus (in: firmicutes)]MCP1122854.1 hypothetical protein [Bacillus sp. 3103sda1]PEZ09376.1 hypothetical protein CN326_03340 [Bacillus sp. AFS018417]
MGAFFLDFAIVAALVIGITATVGIITNGIGEKLFGGKDKMKFVDKSSEVQAGWNKVGGKGIYKKHTY